MNQPAQSGPSLRRGLFARALFGVALALSLVTVAHAQTSGRLARPALVTLDPGDGSTDGGWTRVPFSATDDSGRVIQSEIYQIVGEKGVALAPIPELIRDQLIEELASVPKGETVVFTLNAPIVDEIQRSLELGEPTKALVAYAEQDLEMAAARGCADTFITRSKRLQYTPNFSTSEPMGGGFTGTLQVEGGGNLDANGEMKLRVKRAKVWFLCVPYGVRFEHVRTVGSVSLESTLTLNGSISYANPSPFEHEVAKPFLGGFAFMAGPLPVYIGFNLPIVIGVEIKASVTGQLQYRGGNRITGSFDYLCTASRCTGYNDIQNTVQNIDNPFGAGVAGRIQPSLYADLAVRGFLYHDTVAYAQVGVRGYLHGDLWGYYGNTCGDADQDGNFETVKALTFGLDWQVAVTAKADTFLTRPWKKTLWESKRWYIGFWDLIGSSALTPMIDGPAFAGTGNTTAYKLRMRPCWPYADNIDYTMNWGDGTASNHSGPPAPPSWQPVVAAHVWDQPGAKPMRLTAWRDAHGRRFGDGRSTSRTIQVGPPPPVNLAREALAVASTTYCAGAGTIDCYSPARVNDGSNSTTLGGFDSWSNNNGVSMPQWVELQWGRMVTFSRIELYTSEGFPIRDYDVEYWTGTEWAKAVSIRGNTALHLTHRITPVQTFRMRILALSGPSNQVIHARVNEIELY